MRTQGKQPKKLALCATNKPAKHPPTNWGALLMVTWVDFLLEAVPWKNKEMQRYAEYHPTETSLLVLSSTPPRSTPANTLSGGPPGRRQPQMCNNSPCTQLTSSSAWEWPSFNPPVHVWAVVAQI